MPAIQSLATELKPMNNDDFERGAIACKQMK